MMTTGSPTHERNSEAQHVGPDKNLVDGEDQELGDDVLFQDDDSDEDSLLPPPETPEGSLVSFKKSCSPTRDCLWLSSHQPTFVAVWIRRG
jgi:hypothetical protein